MTIRVSAMKIIFVMLYVWLLQSIVHFSLSPLHSLLLYTPQLLEDDTEWLALNSHTWEHLLHLCPTYLIHSGFSDSVDLWVIKIKQPMILCARSTLKSSEQRLSSESMWKVCLFYSQHNKILWLSKMADTFVREIHQVRKGLWDFVFLDSAHRVLIG